MSLVGRSVVIQCLIVPLLHWTQVQDILLTNGPNKVKLVYFPPNVPIRLMLQVLISWKEQVALPIVPIPLLLPIILPLVQEVMPTTPCATTLR